VFQSEENMKKDYIYQLSIRNWIEKSLGNEIMVPVWGNNISNGYDIYIQSLILPLEAIDKEMETDTYNANTMLPGITVYGSWESDEKVYHQWNNSNGYEPIVIERDFDGLAAKSVEIVEEFRLLFNLYHNQQKQEYVDLANGDNITVIKFEENGFITIHKRYLKTYLAVKEKALLLHVDSKCTEINNSTRFSDDGFAFRNNDNNLYYTLNIGNCSNGLKRENYSVIYAKKVIKGCSLLDCNIWPYNQDKDYIDFIIDIDDNGKEIEYTCNPQKLRNYFGANPTAPHYLTPVYFDSAVLNKYYSKPEIYKVEDGIIRCGTLWALYVDNHNTGYISAYLGDLGRDLPSKQEQHYWRGFNKIINGHLSETKLKRDFMSIAADAESLDFVFKMTYKKTNNLFETKLGWPLFLPLAEQDIYNFETLRIPINNSIAEMDMLVLSLVKILIDSLNEKMIFNHLTSGHEKLVGSITKIETLFSEKSIPDYEKHIKFLRNLQELRSSGTGHRKGKGYQKITKVFDMKKENYAETFSAILSSAIEFLKFIESNIDKLV